MKRDVEVIEAKQKEHRMEYEKRQQKLAHLTWRQRKAVLYKSNKHLMFSKPKERTEMDKNMLSIIVKGVLFCSAYWSWASQMLSLKHSHFCLVSLKLVLLYAVCFENRLVECVLIYY